MQIPGQEKRVWLQSSSFNNATTQTVGPSATRRLCLRPRSQGPTPAFPKPPLSQPEKGPGKQRFWEHPVGGSQAARQVTELACSIWAGDTEAKLGRGVDPRSPELLPGQEVCSSPPSPDGGQEGLLKGASTHTRSGHQSWAGEAGLTLNPRP